MSVKQCRGCKEVMENIWFADDENFCGFCTMRSEKEKLSVMELADEELTDLGIYLKRKKLMIQKVDDFVRNTHEIGEK